MLLREKMTEYITENREIFPNSDREHSDEKTSNEKNCDEENFDEEKLSIECV